MKRVDVVEARIVELLFLAVDDLNRQLRKPERLERSLETRLSGPGSSLDSLGVINLLVLAEQRLEGAYGMSVMLADEEALAREPSPFRSLGSLAEHMHATMARRLAGS